MELRHLRYFVAVAEAGSLKLAAEQRLHTAQPSLSRQIRDLEQEIGARLLTRSVQGSTLTPAGQVFLEHARRALQEAEAGAAAARRAAVPAKAVFAVGFLTGQEVAWLARATHLLSKELPTIEIRVSSGFSVNLADDLLRGRIDVAFLRHEPAPALAFRRVARERLVAVLPADHPLAGRRSFDVRQLTGEIFIGISAVPRVLRGVVNLYLRQAGVAIVPRFEIDNFAMAISLVQSERGIALLPASIEGYLPPTVVARRLRGRQPGVDLMVGYRRDNASPVLRMFLSRIAALEPAPL